METKDNNQDKKAESAKPENKAAEKKGSDPKSKEPTLRSYTTDSSRAHKNSHDEGPTGGNIR